MAGVTLDLHAQKPNPDPKGNSISVWPGERTATAIGGVVDRFLTHVRGKVPRAGDAGHLAEPRHGD